MRTQNSASLPKIKWFDSEINPWGHVICSKVCGGNPGMMRFVCQMRAKRNKYPESENYYPFRRWHQSCDLLHAWVLSPSSWDWGEIILRSTFKRRGEKNLSKTPSPLWSYHSVVVGCWWCFTNNICFSPVGGIHKKEQRRWNIPNTPRLHPHDAGGCSCFVSLWPKRMFSKHEAPWPSFQRAWRTSVTKLVPCDSVSLFENAEYTPLLGLVNVGEWKAAKWVAWAGYCLRLGWWLVSSLPCTAAHRVFAVRLIMHRFLFSLETFKEPWKYPHSGLILSSLNFYLS